MDLRKYFTEYLRTRGARVCWLNSRDAWIRGVWEYNGKRGYINVSPRGEVEYVNSKGERFSNFANCIKGE